MGSLVAPGPPALPYVDIALLVHPMSILLLLLPDRPPNRVPAMPAGAGNPGAQGTPGQSFCSSCHPGWGRLMAPGRHHSGSGSARPSWRLGLLGCLCELRGHSETTSWGQEHLMLGPQRVGL